MNLFKLLAAFVALLVIACASNSSASDSEEKISSDSKASYGIVPIDTTIQDYVDPIEGTISSSSKTEFRFSTERTILYDSAEVFVAAYYQENALQGSVDRAGGSATFTYRLLNSPTDSSKIFVGWLLSGGYWSEDCLSDSTYFVKRCQSLDGELVDYNEGCAVNNLQLSCVYPNDVSDLEKALAVISKEFLEFALEG